MPAPSLFPSQSLLSRNVCEGDAPLYLDLLKRCLTDTLTLDDDEMRLLREEGRDMPKTAYTMIGMQRLCSLQSCAEDIIRHKIPGDFIEAGVWRGGACILLRAILKIHGANNRTVWVADSFCGLPPPDLARYPQDAWSDLHHDPYFAVSLEEVLRNFCRFNLLDEHVRFLPGWFKDILPGAPIEYLALLRIDADLYESTYQALDALYPRLSSGGYCIIDDYGCFAACREAVDDYRKAHNIRDTIIPIDWTGIFWKRESSF